MIDGDLILRTPANTARAVIEWRSLLEGRRYNFRMDWTQRGAFWTLNLLDISLVAMQKGTRMVSGLCLTEPFRHLSDWPPGQIFVEDGEGTFLEPGRRSFLGTHTLVYRPLDVVALAAGTVSEVV